jgi:hypothetical protein
MPVRKSVRADARPGYRGTAQIRWFCMIDLAIETLAPRIDM